MSQWTQADVDRIMRHRAGSSPQNEPTLSSKSKYRNVKVEVNGEKFDSKREAAYWMGLKAQEAAGEISLLQRQMCVDLMCPVSGQFGMTVVVSSYVADFTYVDQANNFHVVDAKGHRTALYKLKKKWLQLQTGIVIEEV